MLTFKLTSITFFASAAPVAPVPALADLVAGPRSLAALDHLLLIVLCLLLHREYHDVLADLVHGLISLDLALLEHKLPHLVAVVVGVALPVESRLEGGGGPAPAALGRVALLEDAGHRLVVDRQDVVAQTFVEVFLVLALKDVVDRFFKAPAQDGVPVNVLFLVPRQRVGQSPA